MKSKTADSTFESTSFPVISADVTASGAGLACIVAVHEQDSLAEHLCFVADEMQQLSWTPATEQACSFFASDFLLLGSLHTHLHCCDVQFFESDCIAIAIHDCLADAMIGVSNKPSLSPAYFLQSSHCGTSACVLQTSLQMLVSTFDLPQLFAIEELIIGSGSRDITSSVHADDFVDSPLLNIRDVNDDINQHFLAFDSDSSSRGFSQRILLEVARYPQRIFPATFDSAEADLFAVSEQLECVMIESDRTACLFDRSLFESEPFEHLTGLVTDCRDDAAVQHRILLSDDSIGQSMQLRFVVDFILKPDVDAVLTGLIADEDCVPQSIIGFDVGEYCDLHTQPSNHNIYKYVSPTSLYEHSKDTTRNIQYQLSSCVVSEVSQACSCETRTQADYRENHHGSLHTARLGVARAVNRQRPHPCIHIGKADILTDVHCESPERQHGCQGNQRASVRIEILESELLCWNCGNSDRADHPAIHRRTRDEVTSRNSPLHQECSVPLRH